jgi:hypothetical protein
MRSVVAFVIALGATPLATQGPPVSTNTTNMTWHGGAVQHNQVVFTIFWNPTPIAFPDAYVTGVNQFVQDVGGTAYDGLLGQYEDIGGTVGSVTFGGSYVDQVSGFPETALT